MYQKTISKFKSLDKRRQLIFIVLIALIVVNTAVIFLSSMKSVEESVEISEGVMAFIKRIIDPNNRIDTELFHHIVRKAAHFTEFFTLAMLYTILRKKSDEYLPVQNTFMAVPFMTLLTAVLDEFIQSFTGRGTSVRDVMLDFSGSLCGIIITIIIYNIIKIKPKNSR